MKHIWYNPLSSKGIAKKYAYKLYKKLKDKEEIKLHKIKTFADFDDIKSITADDDEVILVGGDGALHYFVCAMQNIDFKFKVFLYRAGSGNDFAREHKGRLFEITNEIKNLPYVTYNRVDEDGSTKEVKEYFINGMGSGIDAQVCYNVNHAKVKSSYFKIAVNTFKTFKNYSINITVDGEKYHYDNVWFCAVQNGKYFGGGMKIAPYAKRDDDYLDIYIITSPKRRKVVTLFPTIFIGKHVWFKKVVKYHKGSNIEIEIEDYDLLQVDGETRNYKGKLIVNR